MPVKLLIVFFLLIKSNFGNIDRENQSANSWPLVFLNEHFSEKLCAFLFCRSIFKFIKENNQIMNFILISFGWISNGINVTNVRVVFKVSRGLSEKNLLKCQYPLRTCENIWMTQIYYATYHSRSSCSAIHSQWNHLKFVTLYI